MLGAYLLILMWKCLD